MQSIAAIHESCRQAGRPALSCEFFPPRTPEGLETLFSKTAPALRAANLDYCSVTYGAGGSTRGQTLEIVERLQTELGWPAMLHLTCVNATRAELAGVLAEARARGIRNVLALRGDPPEGGAFEPTPGGFMYSKELIAFLRETGGFSIGTAGFPEGHIACAAGRFQDWEYLREKVQAGADFIITQLFFDNEDFFRFHEHVSKKLGVGVPIIPGILPILSAHQTKKFVALCGAKLPAEFLRKIESLAGDDAAVTAFGIDYAAEQCAALLRYGVAGLHFYTLNKAHSALSVLERLGL